MINIQTSATIIGPIFVLYKETDHKTYISRVLLLN